MPNLFAEQPTLEPGFPKVSRTWTCPFTGMVVPKDPNANLQWRAAMLLAAETDEELQVDLYTACSQSLLFFINAFCFTLRVFEPSGETGKSQQAEFSHLPYVTWEIQDQHLLRLEHALEEGSPLLTDKSRDMGATWNHIALYVHRFLFAEKPESYLMISRKEDAVDILDALPKNYPFGPLSAPGTLFGKIDYILSRLPEWMLPKMGRKKMHLVNQTNGVRIDGESANASAGSGDRLNNIFLDEMAKMEEGEAIWRSTADASGGCRFACSTPNGAGTKFSQVRLSGQIPVFILPWWEHPEKGKNRYVQQDELGRHRIRSPWYDHECTVRTPKEMAVEIDMDHIGSGDTFFEAMLIEEHRKLHARPPKRVMNIAFKASIAEARIPEILVRRETKHLVYLPSGKWKVWCNLIKGRPDQTRTYTITADISMGQGASNSVINVMCNETREKIVEFADANTSPHALAKLACAAALWAGGRSLPLLIWENNGNPGFDFGNQVCLVYKYPNVYFDRVSGTLTEKRGKRFGWRSQPEKKAAALGMLRRAYAHGGFINHSDEALTEALSYVELPGGGIGPAELVKESESVRKAHGDRVIADMLCVVAVKEMPKNRRPETHAPTRSFAHRMKMHLRQKAEAASTDSFNFTGN